MSIIKAEHDQTLENIYPKEDANREAITIDEHLLVMALRNSFGSVGNEERAKQMMHFMKGFSPNKA